MGRLANGAPNGWYWIPLDALHDVLDRSEVLALQSFVADSQNTRRVHIVRHRIYWRKGSKK